MLKFFKNLFSSDGEISSKRVVGFGSFILFAAIVIVHLYTKTSIQEAIIWSTVALITGCFALNTFIDMKAISSKSQVASDLAKNSTEEPAASKAQQIINNSSSSIEGTTEEEPKG